MKEDIEPGLVILSLKGKTLMRNIGKHQNQKSKDEVTAGSDPALFTKVNTQCRLSVCTVNFEIKINRHLQSEVSTTMFQTAKAEKSNTWVLIKNLSNIRDKDFCPPSFVHLSRSGDPS